MPRVTTAIKPKCRIDPSRAPFPIFLCKGGVLARRNGKGILVFMVDNPDLGAWIDEEAPHSPPPRPLNKAARQEEQIQNTTPCPPCRGECGNCERN